MSALQIRNVRKGFGQTEVLRNVNLSVDSGEMVILVGPSGCGKSTLMNAIAGLEPVTDGEIRIGDEDVTWRTPAQRDIAMVFQSYALYPSMTVRKNIAFGLEMRKVPKPEREAAVARVAELLQLTPLLDRKPAQLSGGQRQRVAMGRAIAREPTLYLFDEPLSNLDAKLRVEMRTEIKKLHRSLGTTIVYVTHDQIEAMTLADRIAVMRDGELLQVGEPEQIYNDPVDMFVAGFMGSPSMNFVPARLDADGSEGLSLVVPGHGGDAVHLPLPWARTVPELDQWVGREVLLGVRPEHISEQTPWGDDDPDMTALRTEVTVAEPTGADILLRIRLGEHEVTARIGPKQRVDAGDVLSLQVDMSRAVLFDPDSERRIA